MGLTQIEQIQKEMVKLEVDIQRLEREALDDQRLSDLAQAYHLPQLSQRSQASDAAKASPFKTYRASTGHRIRVGKSAHDNDELSKMAKSNDYWLHAVGVTGSHVIVPVTPDIRASLPTQLSREAAILAIYFSKLKADAAGECYLTRKAQIKKPKGLAPGLWQIAKSETIFIRYTEDELQGLLATVQI
jgi:predicted ribosome quality control (RQC) complex YloA/Tae2 family protein